MRTLSLDRLLLISAILVPVLYFGIQLLLAPLTPGYDLRTQATSLLGADGAPYSAWFNGATILSGVAAIVGGLGIVCALGRESSIWVRALLALALIGLGFGNIWAGTFALPDPRHAANPFAPAFFALPLLLCGAGWIAPRLRGLRLYLGLNLVLFAAMVPVMVGVTMIDRAAYGGLLQRILALAIMLPIGIIGWHLLRDRDARP